MKSSADPRHQRRRDVVQELFAKSFTTQSLHNELTAKVLANSAKIDVKIAKAAPTWPVDKLNKIDLAILRLAIYELSLGEAPPKVVIDEAVELAKEFGSENSPSFVNGVLGTVYEESEEKAKSNE